MTWADYLGIPFRDGGRDRSGCDCWGLVKLVYRERYGLELPEHGPYGLAEGPAIAALVEAGRAAWQRIDGSAIEGDVALLFVGGAPTHVGVMVDDHRMLHVARGLPSRIDRLGSPVWRARLEGIYRWPGRT